MERERLPRREENGNTCFILNKWGRMEKMKFKLGKDGLEASSQKYLKSSIRPRVSRNSL